MKKVILTTVFLFVCSITTGAAVFAGTAEEVKKEAETVVVKVEEATKEATKEVARDDEAVQQEGVEKVEETTIKVKKPVVEPAKKDN